MNCVQSVDTSYALLCGATTWLSGLTAGIPSASHPCLLSSLCPAHLAQLRAAPWCVLASWPKFKLHHFVPHFLVAMHSGFTIPLLLPKKTLSDLVQKKSAHKLFRPCLRSALRAAFWEGILGRTSRKWFKRISMHACSIATSETSPKATGHRN